MSHYPLFEAAGAPFELGRQHGEQAREPIRGFLDFLSAGLKLSRDQVRRRAAQFVPLMERTCPRLMDEVRGLAAGAGIDERDALACQFRGELAFVSDDAVTGEFGTAALTSAPGTASALDGGCTTFVIGRRGTADGGTLIGQNSDNPVELMDYAYVLRLIPDDGPRILMWTFGGMLGYHGVNARGVAHFANSLGGGPAWRFALSHYPVKRMILERGSLDDVRTLLRSTPVCSNGNYVLSDGVGNIVDVELTSDGPHEIHDDGAGFLVHSNHYICGAHACAANFAQSLPDSFPRLNRLRDLIAGRFGRLTVADLRAYLSDHEGHPTAICRHSHEGTDHPVLPASGRTVCSLIAEPDRGLLHVARGNPCENAFQTWSLHERAH